MFNHRIPMLACLVLSLNAIALGDGKYDGLEAHLQLRSPFVQIGQPVWATFLLENTGDEMITVRVPDTQPEIPAPEIGLPLSHVFSGDGATGVSVVTESGRGSDVPVGYRAVNRAPILTIAPHSVVGTTIDLREHFPAMRSPGVYRLTWQPYDAAISSDTVVLEIAPLKQAEILTDFGKLTIRFFYEDAPNHVANFIELAESRFYDNLTFHGIVPGYALLGGCPRGDGTGIRTDGKRLSPEFNARPHTKGTVSMALIEGDPESASCQFFICNTRQKDWDGRYTVFGELIGEESFITLDRIMAQPIDENGRPERPIHIRSVRITVAQFDPTYTRR